MEVRFEYMMPAELDAAMAACPTLYLPLGTIEWHGLHNVVGLDAVKARALCVKAAEQGGGIVHPALYGGVGGLSEPHTFIVDELEESLDAHHLRNWLERLVGEAARQGFKAVLIVTGHYGSGQQIAVRETAVRMTRRLGIPVLGTPEYFLALDEAYYGDHAAAFETSLMMHLFPEKVDLSRLGTPPYQGVGGQDPKEHASAAMGERFTKAITGRLAQLAMAMPKWDDATRARYLAAEQALVGRQFSLAASEGNSWAGWRNIGQGVFDAYPQLLVEERFEEIAALTEKL